MFHMFYHGEQDSLDNHFIDINNPLFYCPSEIDDFESKEITIKNSNNTREQTNISENKNKCFEIIKELKKKRSKKKKNW